MPGHEIAAMSTLLLPFAVLTRRHAREVARGRASGGCPPAAPVLIVGGGLTGLSTALHLRRPYLLLEREARLGGLARTEERDGFCFDQTGHWLHLRDPGMQAARAAAARRRADAASSAARGSSRTARSPATRSRPTSTRCRGRSPTSACSATCERLRRRGASRAAQLRGVQPASLRRGHRPPLHDPLQQQALGRAPARDHQRVVPALRARAQPRADARRRGGRRRREIGYNVRFLYPRRGGIETPDRARWPAGSTAATFAPAAASRRIDPRRRTCVPAARRCRYRALVSTMPLPELVARLRRPAGAMREAAARLRCTPLRYLNVASARPPPERLPLDLRARGAVPLLPRGRLLERGREHGAAGLLASTWSSPSASRCRRDDAARRRGGARARRGAARSASVEDVLFADLREMPYAYVIFDENY